MSFDASGTTGGAPGTAKGQGRLSAGNGPVHGAFDGPPPATYTVVGAERRFGAPVVQMRILVLGANGMLGRDVVAALAHGHSVIASEYGTGDCPADLLDPASVESALGAARPDVVVNCAAYTDVERAESEPAAAFALNAEAVGHLARSCRGRGIALCHVSTDFVFDGTKGEPYDETDEPNPLNVYGASKLAGERALRETATRFWLVRTQWLFAPHGRNFALTMRRLAREGREIRVVADQWGAPSYASDVASAIGTIIGKAPFGVYHVNNDGECSWYEFARAVLETGGFDASRLVPVTADEYPSDVRRPRRSTLRRSALKRLGLDDARHWQAAVEDFTRAVQQLDGQG